MFRTQHKIRGAYQHLSSLLVFFTALCVPTAALAIDDLIVVPYSQIAPTLPHPVHEGARVTLKAMIRNTTCNAGYRIAWDVDRDGDYNDEASQDYTPWGHAAGTITNVVWEIGRSYLVPSVPRDESLNINVRAINLCNNNEIFGTYRMFVYDFTPSPDPRNWTDEELNTMAIVAAGEAIWYLYRNMTLTGTHDASTHRGWNSYTAASPLTAWLMAINSHQPAYHPGSYNDFGQPTPNGWEAANDARFANDPYAEASMRLINYTLNGSGFVPNVPAADEVNTAGFDENGAEIARVPIPGTDDLRGVYGNANASVYMNGMMAGTLPILLPSLYNTRIQVAPVGIVGETYEWFTQQLVDTLTYHQFDAGCDKGGWLYSNQASTCGTGDASTTQWAFIGFESAEIAGAPYGVFVNNRGKYRIPDYLMSNQAPNGLSDYRTSFNNGNFQLTGGAILAGRWLGLDQFAAGDNANPWPTYQSHSKGALRAMYDRYLQGVIDNWEDVQARSSIGWLDGLWSNGDYLCGNTNAVYNAGRCGNTYAMYSHTKAYISYPGPIDQVGPYDWRRQFDTYYVRAQNRPYDANNPWSGYTTFGQVSDAYCNAHSVTCSYGPGVLSGAQAGLVLTPAIFNPPPNAVFTALPETVTEGCLGGGNSGLVTFDHSDSFHPNPEARIISYEYDVNADNGLTWELNQPADIQTPGLDGVITNSVQFRFEQAGVYTVTLRVSDSVGQTRTTTRIVTVEAADNVAPAAAHGGPYAMEAGQVLNLAGSASDVNEACGDVISAAWDLDGDGLFDDANAANAVVPWNVISGLAEGVPHPIRMRVTDSEGLTVVIDTTLIIYPNEPVADARANPNPTACPQEVRFDGNGSFHPNPARAIAAYEWDIDGDGDLDGAGATFRHTYNSFGTYTVTLRVTDDLGRTGETQIQVVVDQGNLPPIARTSQDAYDLSEGDALVLDARNTSEPNAACGDQIVEYAWDLNNDGDFNDPEDQVGANPTINWMTVAQAFGWDPALSPLERTVTLRVTDSFGEISEKDITVTVFGNDPIAICEQIPGIAPVNLVTGFSNPQVDGRNSFSPTPDRQVVIYDWDLDGDGVFEVQNQPVIEYVRLWNPIPAANEFPDVFITLRVTDNLGNTGSTQCQIHYRVPPTPPFADADPSDPPEVGYHIILGQDLTLDASQSFDPDTEEFGDIITHYRWDLNYDGNNFNVDVELEDADGDLAEQVTTIPAAVLAAAGINGPGEYTIALEIEDTTNLTDFDTATLYVYDDDPNAVAVANPNPSACNERVTFDASASDHEHPDIDVVAWRWDMDNDGQYDDANGEIVTWRFEAFSLNGPYTVGLEVEDSLGHIGTTTLDVVVNLGNLSPVPQPGGIRDVDGNVIGPYLIALGEGLQLSAVGSTDPDVDCGDAIVRYEWDVDSDGNYDFETETPNALTAADLAGYGINATGDYDITLRVTDRLGATGVGVATLRVVNGPTAVAEADPNVVGCLGLVDLDGTASFTDGPAALGFALVDWAWDIDGDGDYSDGNGQRFSVAAVGLPEADGVIRMRISLRVTDAAGRTDTTEVIVEIAVQNLPPTANAGGPYQTGPVGGGNFADVLLDARASFDPNQPCDEVVEYRWDTDGDGLFGNDDPGGDLVGAQVAYNNPNWQVNTAQTVRLIVCDAAGLCSPPAEVDIAVRNSPPPTGEILSPRGDGDPICIGAGSFDLELALNSPTGTDMTVVVTIGGAQVAEVVIDGAANNATIAINANLIPEGTHTINVTITDQNGGQAVMDSGPPVPFDRTPPVVTIGAQPGADACYLPNLVPEPIFSVDDGPNGDPAPTIEQSLTPDGCARTLLVRGTDSCGNVGEGTRTFQMAQQAAVAINGPAEGELVADARVSWQLLGPPECVSNDNAQLARNGGAFLPYPENALINQPGDYVLRVLASNCNGISSSTLRSFTVNAPPVAVPVPAAHPRIDLGANNAYIVAEGGGLQVDCGDSTPPENDDFIALCEWDWNINDGAQFADAQGELAPFPTDDDGVFIGIVRVTDSIGATSNAGFQVTVTDVDPIADPGGPYVVLQGQPSNFDGSGSQPGSPADLITVYRWEWGDGTPDTVGANEAMPDHTYADNGIYTIRLTITDEDSSHSVTVPVEVRDADPVIGALTPPLDATEIIPFTVTLAVEPGAPNDPIERIEYDFNNDGVADCWWPSNDPDNCASPDGRSATWSHISLGDYPVVVRVRDTDSMVVTGIDINVREITFAEIIEYSGLQIELALGDENNDIFAKLPLQNADIYVQRGLWGERNDRRGNTLKAVDHLLDKMTESQSLGIDFGIEIWGTSRAMQRELRRQYDAVSGEEANFEERQQNSLARALGYVETLEDTFFAPEFMDDVFGEVNPDVALQLWASAYEAYFWLEYISNSCTYEGFPLPNVPDPLQRARDANAVNTRLTGELGIFNGDLQAYIAEANNPADPGPAGPEVTNARSILSDIRDLQPLQVGTICMEGEVCVTDLEALQVEHWMMDMASELLVAATAGAYERMWSACLVEAVKFRIELSILRVEFACGLNNAFAVDARNTQSTGLDMYENGLISQALEYYSDVDRRCKLVEIYNGCLVPANPDENPEFEVPIFCLDDL